MIKNPLMKKIALLIVCVLLILLAFYVGWRFIFFNLISSNPSSDIIPSSQSTVVYTFSHNLSDKSSAKVTGIDQGYRVDIDKGNLRIVFGGLIDTGSNLNIEVNAISESNNTISFSRKYTVTYVDFSDLPKVEQERQVEESAGFEDKYPLVKHLPVSTPDFDINYLTPDEGETKVSIEVICKNNIDLDNLLSDEPRDATSCLSEARKYLKDIGYNDREYIILNDINPSGHDD